MGKSVLITGASRGIGLSLCEQYVAAGWQVLGVCRKASEALKQLGVTLIEDIELTEPTKITNLPNQLTGRKLDLLILNAGILNDDQLGSIDAQSLEKQYKVNAIAPLLIIDCLKNHLNPKAKIALITSRMGSIADNTSGGRYGYRMSKAALNAAGMSLVHDLKPQQVSVAILHPGFVATDMVGGSGQVSPGEAAAGLKQRIDELNLENTGTFWHANGEVLPW